MMEPAAGILAMKFNKDEIHQARAKYCVSQAALARDEEIKKFWDDLANEWLEIDSKARGQSILQRSEESVNRLCPLSQTFRFAELIMTIFTLSSICSQLKLGWMQDTIRQPVRIKF